MPELTGAERRYLAPAIPAGPPPAASRQRPLEVLTLFPVTESP